MNFLRHKSYQFAKNLLRWILCIFALLLLFTGKVDAAELKVTMFDVGQGDAFLIQTDSENILIDTGDSSVRDRLIFFLDSFNVDNIDYLILTHPHADHIANAAYLLSQNRVLAVYDNGRASASQYYRNYLQACKELNIPRYTLREGDYFFLADGAYIQILSANHHAKNQNNDCIVARLVYDNFSMIFTGDAEFDIENELFQSDYTLHSTALKAGHHGSRTSNCLDFVKAVAPTYVLISAAENNRYGHPHPDVIDTFLMAGVDKNNIFWTGKNGTVTITTDGNNISVKPQRNFAWVDYYRGYDLNIQTIWTED